MLSKRSKRSVLETGKSASLSDSEKTQTSRSAVDRSCLGALNTVTELDRRGSAGKKSPNSRLNRDAEKSRTSSHSQDRVNTIDNTAMNPTPLWVGIDIAKGKFDVHVRPLAKKWTFNNDLQGATQLLAELQKLDDIRVLVVEASGGYERSLVSALIDAKIPVAVVNPKQARDFAKGLGRRAKTDAIDAADLAHFAEVVQPKPTPKTPEKQQELQDLVTRRRQLIQIRTMESNRLPLVLGNVPKQTVQDTIHFLEKQLAVIEQAISKLFESDDDWKAKANLLTSVPGVGENTAQHLLAEIPELGDVNRTQVAALAGLAPYNHDSGLLKGKRAISGGRANVRTALYMATLAARRFNPTLKAFAERLQNLGKPFRVVHVACMRKLLVILNALIKSKQPWNPQTQTQST